jgi:hypothetical protein
MRRKLQALGPFAAPFFLRNNGADRTKLARRCFLAQVFSLTFHGLASQAERPRTKPLKIMMSSPPAEARLYPMQAPRQTSGPSCWNRGTLMRGQSPRLVFAEIVEEYCFRSDAPLKLQPRALFSTDCVSAKNDPVIEKLGVGVVFGLQSSATRPLRLAFNLREAFRFPAEDGGPSASAQINACPRRERFR